MGKDKDKPPSNDDAKPDTSSGKSDASDSRSDGLRAADEWIAKYGGRK